MRKKVLYHWNRAKSKEHIEEEIKTIKPRILELKLSDADVERIFITAGAAGLSVESLLEKFIGDLVYGTCHNSSEEYMDAQHWLNHGWGMFPEKTFFRYLLGWSELENVLETYDRINEVKIRLVNYEDKKEIDEEDDEKIEWMKIEIFGSGAVFFNKLPAKIETLNDLDRNVVNYFKIVRERPEELMSQLNMTPYSRDEYYQACEYTPDDSDVEKARKFAVRCWQGFGCSNLYRNGFRSSQQRTSPHTTKEWRNLPERLMEASERLKNAQIENLPAVEVIKRYDTADVFMYIDPPYLHGTRKNYLYRYEMEDRGHIELLELLQNHPGKILLSGYDNNLYNDMLPEWHKVHKKTQAEAGVPRIETLWMNYEIGQNELVFNH